MDNLKVGDKLVARDYPSTDYCFGKRDYEGWRAAPLFDATVKLSGVCEIINIHKMAYDKVSYLIYFPAYDITDSIGPGSLYNWFSQLNEINKIWRNLNQ